MDDVVAFSPSSTPDGSGGVGCELAPNISRNINNILSLLESPSTASPSLKNVSPGPQLNVLKDVIAYVEVRSKHENRSRVIENQLSKLGAEVVPKLGPEVTHVVFKEGNKSTRDRAVKKGIHLVSVLWVDSCKQNGEHMAESLFPVQSHDSQKQPLYFQQKQARLRKFKSMQPKDFEEEVVKSAERGEKLKKKRFMAAERLRMATPTSPLLHRVYVEETQPRSPMVRGSSPNLVIPDTPPNMQDLLSSLSKMKHPEQESNTPLSGDRSPPPLQRRLFVGLSPAMSSVTASTASSPVVLPRVSSSSSSSGRSSPQIAAALAHEESSHKPVFNSPNIPNKPSRRSRSKKSGQPCSPSLAGVEVSPSVVQSTTRRRKSSIKGCQDSPAVTKPGRRRKSIPESNQYDHISTSGKESHPSDDPSVVNAAAVQSDHLFEGTRLPADDVPVVGFVPVLSASRASSPVQDLPQDAVSCVEVVAVEPAKSNRRGRRKTIGPALLEIQKDMVENPNVRKSRRQSVAISASAASACYKFDEITSPERSDHRRNSPAVIPENNSRKAEPSCSKNGGGFVMETESTKSTPDSESESSFRKRKKRLLLPLDHGIEPAMLVSPVLSTNTKQSMEKLYSPKQSKKNVRKKTGEQTLKDLKSLKRKNDEASGSDPGMKNPKAKKQNCQTVGAEKLCNPNAVEIMDTDKPAVVNYTKDKVIESVKRRRSVRLSVGIESGSPGLDSHHNSLINAKPKIDPTGEESQSSDTVILPSKQVTKLQNSTKSETPVRRRSMRRSIVPPPTFDVNTPTLSQVESRGSEITKRSDAGDSACVTLGNEKCPADFDSTLEESLHEKIIEKKRKRKLASQALGKLPSSAAADVSSDSGMSEMDDTGGVRSTKVPDLSTGRNRMSMDEFRSDSTSMLKSFRSSVESPDITKRGCVKNSFVKKNAKLRNHSISMIASELESTPSNNCSVQRKTKSRQKSGSSGSEVDSKCQSKKKATASPSLVMTSLHTVEQDTVRSVVKSLGNFILEDMVSSSTTHVVCGNNRRTLNVLYAIAHGCWLLSLEWVMKSVEAQRWLEEEDFEQNDFFPAAKAFELALLRRGPPSVKAMFIEVVVEPFLLCLIALESLSLPIRQMICSLLQLSRLERMAEKDEYHKDLFSNEGFIFVSEQTSPPQKHMVRILQLCGAKITQCFRKANLCIGANIKTRAVTVSEQWVLDSITSHECLPHDNYIIGGPGFTRSPSPDF